MSKQQEAIVEFLLNCGFDNIDFLGEDIFQFEDLRGMIHKKRFRTKEEVKAWAYGMFDIQLEEDQ